MGSIKRNSKIIILTLFVCFVFLKGNAQDFHYSQFYHAPLSVNPALTGIFNGDKRVTASVRDQWRSVPVPWFTTSIGYDFKISPAKSKSSFFGLGAFLNYDRQGDSKLTLGNINLSGSYHYLLNKNNIITVGLLGGFSLRGYDSDNLTWDSQWNGVGVDTGIDPGENANRSRLGFFESGAGFNYRWQKSSRTKIDLGVGAWHLIEPKIAFNQSDDLVLPRRFSAYAIAAFKLVDNLDIQLDGLYQMQNTYNELLVGAYLDIYLNKKPGKRTNLHIGGGYRISELPAVYPKIAVQYNEFLLAFSYDIDISELSQHTNYRGGPEIHFRYIITDVKPLGQFKTCPIF